MDPLKNIAVGLLKPFRNLIGGLALLVGSIMNLIVRFFGPAIAIVMDIVGVVVGAIGFVIQGVAAVVEKIWDIVSMIPGLGRWFGDADSDKNSTLNSMNKLLESINGMASDSLDIEAKDSRGKEKDRLSKIDPVKTDPFFAASLHAIDKRARLASETQSKSIANAINKLVDSSASKETIKQLREILAAIIAGQSPQLTIDS
jgi:hypothetical protein